ncbi:MAG: hypothetical protein H7A41_03335 [Chlamydiales bacterium]|nr:hypothetical protein [Chlamydiales bacterium]
MYGKSKSCPRVITTLKTFTKRVIFLRLILRITTILFLSLFLTTCSRGHPSKKVIVKPNHIIDAQKIRIEGEDPVTVIKGKLPIIISAPHALEVPRKSGSFADKGTGELAIMLHKICDVTVIYLSSSPPWNPNACNDNVYKETLRELILTEKPKLVIDLHRAHECRPFDIDYGTLHGRSCSNRMVQRLTGFLKEEGITNFSSNFFSASSTDTVTKWAHLHGVEAIQLEINATLLDFDGDRQDLHRFSQLLQGLSTFLLSF